MDRMFDRAVTLKIGISKRTVQHLVQLQLSQLHINKFVGGSNNAPEEVDYKPATTTDRSIHSYPTLAINLDVVFELLGVCYSEAWVSVQKRDLFAAWKQLQQDASPDDFEVWISYWVSDFERRLRRGCGNDSTGAVVPAFLGLDPTGDATGTMTALSPDAIRKLVWCRERQLRYVDPDSCQDPF